MAAASALPALLTTLTDVLNSASSTLPTVESLAPPANGISLLDAKNELFLSYLHNLVFLVVLKLRQARSSLNGNTTEKDVSEENEATFSETVKKLVELRVYLERGVKPLEGRLRYQIDKVVRAADQAATNSKPKQPNGSAKPSKTKPKRSDPAASDSGSDSDFSASEHEQEDETPSDLAYRPNPSAFARPDEPISRSSKKTLEKDAPYRPPRIAPTSLPTTEPRSASSSRRPKRSAAVEEYLTSVSSAPVAEPSIGSTIHSRTKKGRQEQMTARELVAMDARNRYEEENLVRLPGMSKKEKRRLGGEKNGRQGGFGGEEWAGLGEGADRVVEVTRGKGEIKGALERSRKRAREREDGGGDDGSREGRRIGEEFEKRRKRLDARSKRSKGRNG